MGEKKRRMKYPLTSSVTIIGCDDRIFLLGSVARNGGAVRVGLFSFRLNCGQIYIGICLQHTECVNLGLNYRWIHFTIFLWCVWLSGDRFRGTIFLRRHGRGWMELQWVVADGLSVGVLAFGRWMSFGWSVPRSLLDVAFRRIWCILKYKKKTKLARIKHNRKKLLLKPNTTVVKTQASTNGPTPPMYRRVLTSGTSPPSMVLK